MLFVGKWPTFISALDQCALLVEVRTGIGALTGLPVRFITAEDVQSGTRSPRFAAHEKRNCAHIRLAGIRLQLYRIYPETYESYLELCDGNRILIFYVE